RGRRALRAGRSARAGRGCRGGPAGAAAERLPAWREEIAKRPERELGEEKMRRGRAEPGQLNRDSWAGAERPEWRDAPRRFAGVERRDLGDRSERSSFQGRVEREVPRGRGGGLVEAAESGVCAEGVRDCSTD